jgi:sugar phosphate isomerase/epimerase
MLNYDPFALVRKRTFAVIVIPAMCICEGHLKDNPHYLGEGKIDFRAVVDALADVGFDGWAQLETDCPTSVEDDMRRNLKFIRSLIASRNGA